MSRRGYSDESVAQPKDISREASFVHRTPPAFAPQTTKMEFEPLLHTSRPINRHRTPRRSTGILSYDEHNASDSMESFLHTSGASFLRPASAKKDPNERLHRSLAQFAMESNKNQKLVSEEGDFNSMPLKEQEEKFKEQQNEIFRLKLKIVLLTEQLEKTTPESQMELMKENIHLKGELTEIRTNYEILRRRADEKKENLGQGDLERERDVYQSKAEKLESKVEDLEYELRREAEKVEAVELENEKLQSRISSLQDELEEKGDRSATAGNGALLQDLKDEIEDLKYQLRAQEREHDELKVENEQLMDEIEALRTAGHKDTSRISEKETIVDDLQRRVTEKDQIISSLRDKISEKDALIDDLYAKVSDKDVLVERLQDKVAERDDVLERERTAIEAQKVRILELEERSNRGYQDDDKLFDSERRRRNLEKELSMASTAMKELETKSDAQREELDETKKELLRTQTELSSVQLLMTRLNNDMLSLTNERDAMQRQLADIRSHEVHNKTVDESFSEKRYSEIERLRAELRTKQDEIDTKAQSFKRDKEYLDSKIASLERQKEHLESQLEKVLNNDKKDVQSALQAEKNNQKELRRSLEKELEQLQGTLKDVRRQSEQKDTRLTANENVIKTIQSKLDDMEDDLVVCQSQLEQMTAMRDSLQVQLSGLQTSYESQENTLNALRDINKRETDSRVHYQQLVLELESKRIPELSKQCDELSRDKTRLEAEIETLRAKNERYKQRSDQSNIGHSNIGFQSQIHSTPYRGRPVTSNGVPMEKSQAANGDKYYDKCRQLAKQLSQLRRQNEYDIEFYQQKIRELKKEESAASKQHRQELRGMIVQLRYLKSKVSLESSYRSDLGFMKKFFLLQISSYQACNRAGLAFLQEMGIYPDYNALGWRDQMPARHRFQVVATFVLAAVRIQNRQKAYQRGKEHKARVAALLVARK